MDDRYNFTEEYRDTEGYRNTEGFSETDDYNAETNQIFFFDAFGRRFPSDTRFRRRGDFRIGCCPGRCRNCRRRDRFW